MKELVEEIVGAYKWVIKFITTDVWELEIEDFGRAKRRFIRFLKIALIVIKESAVNKIGINAIALTFFSVMSVVPFAAVAFVITGGLGFDRLLEDLLLQTFPSNTDNLNLIIQFADNTIESATKGAFGVISFVFLLGTIIWLIINVERAFNNIWKIERRRSIAKRFLYYFGIVAVAPFVIAIFLSSSIVFSNALRDMVGELSHFQSISNFLQWLMTFVVVLFTFTIMYRYIPNVKVRFSAAFSAAIVTAIAFVGIQILYLETQLFVSRLNKIYGAFTAIPLFLIWMNISWTIILIGAEISHALQYSSTYSNNNQELENEVKKRVSKGAV